MRTIIAALTALALATGLAACHRDNNAGTGSSANPSKSSGSAAGGSSAPASPAGAPSSPSGSGSSSKSKY